MLIRRHIADGEMAFFSTWCPAGTPIAALVAVEGHRWSIEDSFETAKNELGLDHNETRSWHGWHRHVSLVMLAFAMMAIIRNQANAVAATPKKTQARRTPRTRPHPLVGPGNPAHSDTACKATYPTRAHHRLVTLETCPPSHRSSSSPQEIATVMLGRVDGFDQDQPASKSGEGAVAVGSLVAT